MDEPYGANNNQLLTSVEDITLLRVEHLPVVNPRPLLHSGASRQTNGGIWATDNRYRVIQDVFPVDVVDIRRPAKAAAWQINLGALVREDRAITGPRSTATISKGYTTCSRGYSPLQVRAREDLEAFIGREHEVLLELGVVPDGWVAKHNFAYEPQ